VRLPGLEEDEDVSNWLDQPGNDIEALLAFVAAESEPNDEPRPIAATPFSWIIPSMIPPRQFLYGKHLIRQFMSTTVAPGGIGKSSLGIVEGLAMASGKPLLGIQPEHRLRVWLWNGEDPLEELQRRVMAAAQHYGLTPADLEGYLFLDSGRRMPIIIAEQMRDGAKIAVTVVEAVTQTIQKNGIDVVTIDPFVSSHRVSENDNNAVERVAKTWAAIADRTGAAIDLVHHTRKTGGVEATASAQGPSSAEWDPAGCSQTFGLSVGSEGVGTSPVARAYSIGRLARARASILAPNGACSSGQFA
jgi:hypothetical protein